MFLFFLNTLLIIFSDIDKNGELLLSILYDKV